MGTYKYISAAIPRIEGMSLALGRPLYVADSIPENCLHIKLVHCPYASAEVEEINCSIAKAVPGVVKIYTWEDTPIQSSYGWLYTPFEHTPLTRVARFSGDAVAMVVAETKAAALKAHNLIKIKWKIKNAVMDPTTALENKTLVHGDQLDKIIRHSFSDTFNEETDYFPEKNQVGGFVEEFGDTDSIMNSCDTIAYTSCHTGPQIHCQFETHRCFAYIDDRGFLTLKGPMQAVFPVQDCVAIALGIDRRKIRAIKTQVGGGFGGRNIFSTYIFAAIVAYDLKRPAFLELDRTESMTTIGSRHEYDLDITIGASSNGYIRAIDSYGIQNAGAYCEISIDVLETGIHNTYPIFPRVEAIRINQHSVFTNRLGGCAFRGFGATQNAFALNSAVRHLAEKLNMDLSEVFLKNAVQIGDSHPLMNGYRTDDPNIEKSSMLTQCILKAKELIDWDNKRNKFLPEGNVVRGVGIGIASHASGVPRVDRGNVIISMNPDGTFRVSSGHSDIGTGSNTVILQIIAEVLNVPLSVIHLTAADTAQTPFDPGTYASSNAYRCGNAAKRAAEKMLTLLLDTAHSLLKISPEKEIKFSYDGFSDAEGNLLISTWDFADKHGSYWDGGDPLVVSASFSDDFAPSPYSAMCCEIEVDKETGIYRIIQMCAAIDSGQILNPINAKVQALGGIVQSIGMTMFEDVSYNQQGGIINNDFQTYKIPCQFDVPSNLQIEFMDGFEITGPFGAKSLGEISTGAPAPAISDALFNALGVHIDTLPITPERVYNAIKAKEEQL